MTPVPLDQPEQILDAAPNTPEDTQPPAEDTEKDSEIPAIYHYEKDGAAIYTESFAIIRSEAALSGFTPEEEQVGAHDTCRRHG